MGTANHPGLAQWELDLKPQNGEMKRHTHS